MKKIIYLLFVLFICCSASADKNLSEVLLGLSLILLAAKIGGHFAVKFSQPEVLGELAVGIFLGNLGFQNLEFLTSNEIISILSEIGIILLLFEVGLETSVKEMTEVGRSSLLVALLGVIAPFFLGTLCSMYFLPNAEVLIHYFVGATLTATSVGITARVLKEIGKVSSIEGKIILGAAVIDDVLGLLILAVVVAIVKAQEQGGVVNIQGILSHAGIAIGFLIVSVLLGRYLVGATFSLVQKLKSKDLLLVTAVVCCFVLSYLAALAGLAPIVGAFTAGLILEPAHYEGRGLSSQEQSVKELIAPIVSVLVPVFFVTMGAKVDIQVFANTDILFYALCLSIAAIIGKQICALGVLEKGVDRLAVGLGMIPRGEVGLIFAGIGSSLKLHGKPLIDPATFGAVVIMVMITTMVTPSLIKWRFSKN
jgi:Kef-type K+ transport system membrane component KefB